MDINDYIPAFRYGATLSGDDTDITLASGKILVGNSSGLAADVDMAGDATISNAGAVTIANGAVTNAKVSGAAAIAHSKLAAATAGQALIAAATTGSITAVTISGDARMASTGSMTLEYGGTLAQGLPFIVSSSSIGTATLNTGTGWVDMLTTTVLGGRTPYITGFTIKNTGDVDCAGGSSIMIMDSNGVKIWEIAFAGLSAQATLTASGTLYSFLHGGATLAGTAAKAVGLKMSDGSLTGTPTIKATIWGILK